MNPELHVVLVRSEHSGNVGATCRAMANMGCEHLILIDPRCPIDGEARALAAGQYQLLDRARIYSSWPEFFKAEGYGLRLGLTRRVGRERKVFSLSEKLREIQSLAPEDYGDQHHLYLIFGPEADGLDHEDLAYVNFAVHLPVFGDFASLNLSQAVLLSLFMARQTFPPQSLPEQLKGPPTPVVQPLYFPDDLIKEWLTTMGFDLKARRSSAYLTLRRLFLQSLPTRHEIQVLEAILQQNIRKLRGSIGFASEKVTDDLGDIPGEDV
jgi:tRNA (cytidine32/uridine32-2'-O)-methyltransferase